LLPKCAEPSPAGNIHCLTQFEAHHASYEHRMNDTLAITKVESVEAVEAERFEVRLLLEDTSEIVLRMDGPTLCSLADMASQYATP
jgi:hypothetical protein